MRIYLVRMLFNKTKLILARKHLKSQVTAFVCKHKNFGCIDIRLSANSEAVLSLIVSVIDEMTSEHDT